jgi:hypothetical protein
VRVGAENRKELIAAIVLAVLAVVSVTYWVMSSPTTAATGTIAVSVTSNSTRPAPRTTVNPDTIDPTLRLDILRASESIAYSGHGRDIFTESIDIPKPIAHVVTNPGPAQPVCPGDPRCPPPPINLKFYGFANKPGEPKRVFLQEGENIFIAGEGEVVDRRYKIVHIGVNSVDIQDLLNNNTQTIPLTSG